MKLSVGIPLVFV